MKHHGYRFGVIMIALSLILSGCAVTPQGIVFDPSAFQPPAYAGPPVETPNNVTVRVDWIELVKNPDIFEIDGVAEMVFTTAIILQDGRSSDLVQPGSFGLEKYFEIRAGERVALDNFSLTANDLNANELVNVVFFAMDLDETEEDLALAQDLAVDGIQRILTRLVIQKMFPGLTLGGFWGFVVSEVASYFSAQIVELIRESEPLGLYFMQLPPEQDWLRNQSFVAESSDGNIRLGISIIGTPEALPCKPPAVPEVAPLCEEPSEPMPPATNTPSSLPTATTRPEPTDTPTPQAQPTDTPTPLPPDMLPDTGATNP